MSKLNRSKLADISLIFMGVVLFFIILNKFQSFLRPFTIALILSFLFVPITRYSRKKKMLLMLNSFLIIIFLIFVVIIVQSFFYKESVSADSISNAENFKSEAIKKISGFEFTFFGNQISLFSLIPKEKISNYISNFISALINSISKIFSELFLVILFLSFILPSHDMIVQRYSNHLNKKENKQLKKALFEIEKNIRSYLAIKTTISLGTAIFSLFVMFIFEVKFAFIFSIIIFALNFIPSIGSIIAVMIVLIYELIFSGFSNSFIILAILLILIQIIFGNVLEPKFAGKELNLSPVIILLSLFFWGYIWGVVGMLLAVPITSVIKIILTELKFSKRIFE